MNFFDPRKIRNIGIIAHIDAGKTSITERILFYAGLTRRLGSVDRGDTVMDHLPQERQRGITISSAATTVPWMGQYRINLIDTPGHVDFTVEVDRAIRVMDAAVVILDGRAGVQAQTRTVWRQADRYGLPRLVFVNKMDRPGADFGRVVRQLQSAFNLTPLPIQWPDEAGAIDDLIRNQRLRWLGETEGREIQETFHVNQPRRMEMIERLAAADDQFLEEYLADDDPGNLDIDAAVRRATQARRIVPVLCGSAIRNIGVQPLLDAVIRYLPDPIMKDNSLNLSVGLAFKVVHDPQRGLLVFLRVYGGAFGGQLNLWNSTRAKRERPTRIFRVYADRTEETDCLGPGDIGVLLGLRHT